MIAGICVLRDSIDLVPYLCGHYLRIGFDRLVFVDDHSTDGTYQLLEQLSKKQPRIRVRLSGRQDFRIGEEMTRLANEAIADGFTTVVPFDADEFWLITARRLRSLFAGVDNGLVIGSWIHFAQDRSVTEASRFGVLRIVHRAPVLDDVTPESVSQFKRPFLCHTMPKVIFKSQGPVSVRVGQHELGAGPTTVVARGVELFHIPLRYASEVTKRARNAARVTEHRTAVEQHWQAIHFRDAVAAGRLSEVWAANSADPAGYLDVGGQRFLAAKDTRLRTLLLCAWAHWLLSLRKPR